MNYWNWDPSLSVGITMIDDQHKRIITYLNELHTARNHKDNKKVTQVLTGLIDYTATHFNFEEGLMSHAGYPISTEHQKVHKAFIERIENYSLQHKEGQDITRKLTSELRLWLTNHIKYEDKHYAPYIKDLMSKEKNWISHKLKTFFG